MWEGENLLIQDVFLPLKHTSKDTHEIAALLDEGEFITLHSEDCICEVSGSYPIATWVSLLKLRNDFGQFIFHAKLFSKYLPGRTNLSLFFRLGSYAMQCLHCFIAVGCPFK